MPRSEDPAPRAGALSDLRHRVLEEVRRRAATGSRIRVALVARRPDHPIAALIADEHPGAQVTQVTVGLGPHQRRALLAAGGPYDVILDLADGDAVERRWEDQFLLLRPGGVHLSRLGPQQQETDAPWLRSLLALRDSQDLHAPYTGRDKRPSRERTEHSLAEALVEAEVRDGLAITVNGTATLAKLPETATDTFLAARPGAGQVLDRIDGTDLVSRCVVRSSDPAAIADLPRTFAARPVSLRAYADVECRPRQVAWQGNVVLPDTYRHNQRPRNQQLVDLTPWFTRPPEPATTRLDGAHFYLDSQFRGHFGHALTEQVSRLWGWAEAKRRYPDLKALMFERERYPVAPWELELYDAAGIPLGDVHVATEPVRVETLVGASPMFCMPEVLHPAILRTYENLGEAFSARATQRDWPTRTFCSRRGNRRACHNADEVEALFVAAGFTVVYPEELPLPDQVEMVRRAEVVAGFAGSGMFQIAFAGSPKHVIIVSSDSYVATNEYMISSVVGHRLDVVMCRADIAPAEEFSNKWYHSAFTFDPDREGRFLAGVLAELG